jgi:hypothetical protein
MICALPKGLGRSRSLAAGRRAALNRLLLALAMACALVVSGAPALAAAPPAATGLPAADVGRLSAGATDRSIVIFRDPQGGFPAGQRALAIDREQAPVRGELAQLHAGGVTPFHVVNAVAATISPAEADRLRGLPSVQAVVPDLPVPPAPVGATPAAQPACSARPGAPQVEPEALGLLGATAAQDLADGGGVKVAFLADGVDPGNPDFRRGGRTIFADYRDFTGEGPAAATNGTAAFGAAASIAAQGRQVFDLGQGCKFRVRGVAPGATLVGLEVEGTSVPTLASTVVRAIDWAVNVDHVDVIDEPFSRNVYPDPANDPIALADAAAVAAGVTVVASAGDAGPSSTIGTPSDAPGVIGVGATTQLRLYRQTAAFGSQLVPGGWLSDDIAGFSSAGFTLDGPGTVDVVAPGDSGWALCSPAPRFAGCAGRPLQAFAGSGESASLTAGVAALVIQAFERTHHGARPGPALVKQILLSSATDLHAAANRQGAGLVDALRAVQTAMSVQDAAGAPPAVGDGVLVSPCHLEATVPAGTQQTFTVGVTNAGTAARTLQPSLLALNATPVATDTGTLALPLATAPTFVDQDGLAAGYVVHQFTVPAGTDRLDANVTWDAQGQPGSIVAETLFDPQGNLAGYSRPQGSGGHGHVEVHDATPGTWTDVVWAHKDVAPYSGDVPFVIIMQRFSPVGAVSPATLTLAPGASGTFAVTVPVALGDTTARLALGTGGSVPVTMRGLVPLGPAGGAFQDRFTGGVGAPAFGGHTFTYQFDVPAGEPALSLALKMQNPGYDVTALLVDPAGQPVDVQGTAAAAGSFGSAIQLVQALPRAGRWTVVLVLNDPLPGARVLIPFTGQVGFAGPEVSAPGLPASPATVLARGVPVTVTLQVSNTGVGQQGFFVDPRLDRMARLTLPGVTPLRVTLPLTAAEAEPSLLVPPDTDRLLVTASSRRPVQLDVAQRLGSPDVAGVAAGDRSIAIVAAPEVARGLWLAGPALVGPFRHAVTPVPAAVTAEARTKAFDPAVASSTGDVWPRSGPFTPLALAPGQSGSIAVTITPSAPAGTVVRGVLEVDTFDPLTSSGDQAALLPYEYRVG